MGYRQVVDGTVQVPLPDEPAARAKAFAEVAAAWSTMLSSIEHLLRDGQPAKLIGGTQQWPPGSLSKPMPRYPVSWQPEAQSRANIPPPTAPAPAPAPVAAKPNGDGNKSTAHMAKMRAAKARKDRKRRKR